MKHAYVLCFWQWHKHVCGKCVSSVHTKSDRAENNQVSFVLIQGRFAPSDCDMITFIAGSAAPLLAFEAKVAHIGGGAGTVSQAL